MDWLELGLGWRMEKQEHQALLQWVIISVNFFLVAIVVFYSFFSTSWKLSAWHSFLVAENCFEDAVFETKLKKEMREEVEAAEGLQKIKYSSLVIFCILTVLYLWRFIVLVAELQEIKSKKLRDHSFSIRADNDISTLNFSRSGINKGKNKRLEHRNSAGTNNEKMDNDDLEF